MNLKTTLVLLVLVVAGGVLYQFGPAAAPKLGLGNPPAEVSDAGTIALLETEITPAKLQRIEIRRGDQTVAFQRDSDKTWSLPGKWPTRKQEVDQLVALLTNLRSRFAPIPVEREVEAVETTTLLGRLFGKRSFEATVDAPAGLGQFGLEKPEVTVQVRAGDQDYRLAFGEEPGDGNRFSRATFLRLATRDEKEWKDKPEVIRLAPGLVATLNRPLDFYQQRRLFPSERITKDNDPSEKIDRVSAKTIRWTLGKDEKEKETFTLTRDGDDWKLAAKLEGKTALDTRDRPDPDKLKALLTAVPDIWAEMFVNDPKKTLADYGLDKPHETLTVTRPSGDQVTLLLGKDSPRFLERNVTEPPPPGSPFPAMSKPVKERLRYAKLQDNDQVFEIKADRLKDIFVAFDTARDARLARFRPEDVTGLTLTRGDKTIVLAKEKDAWKLKKPVKASAETAKVTELLDQLSRLEARGLDVTDVNNTPTEKDQANLKDAGLTPPAGTATVTIEEEIKADDGTKTKKQRTIKFLLGKHDKERGRLRVQVEGLPRVNTVKDDLVKLTDRTAVAYRGRTIFDVQPADVKQLEVERDGGKEEFTLEQTPDDWQLIAPVKAAADTRRVADMVRDLCHLSAQEFVNDSPSDKDLEKYGLDKPALRVRMKFSDKLKAPQTLLVGKATGTKYFAKLAARSEPAVFTITKEQHDAFDRPSLAYRPVKLWDVPGKEVKALRVQRQDEPEYRLNRDGQTWKIAGPFDAPVSKSQVEPLLAGLASLRCDRYENHGTKELGKFGLEKPFLRITVVEAGKDKKEKEHVLLIGDRTGKDEPTRFAKLGDSDAVVVMTGSFVGLLNTAALDFLDRDILKFASKNVTKVQSTRGDPGLMIARNKDAWEVQAGETKFTADGTALAALLFTCSNLEADRFAAFGPKVDLAKFGLDKPEFTLTLTVKPDGDNAKPVVHTIAVGKQVEGEKGRYARIDAGPGVVVLGPRTTAELERTYLDFVDRNLLKFDASALAGIVRQMKDQEFELAKREEGWQILKPAEAKADTQSLDALAGLLAKLRAARVAAYPAKDLKTFGLDEPAAVITLRLDGDKKHVLKIGSEVENKEKAPTTNRYAQVEGSNVIAVLPGALVKQLLASPVRFRDRSIARFTNVDKAQLERGPRKATFTQVDGTWKLTEPAEADAEQNELDEFTNALARLRADELVEEKPEDLKRYGLDRPEARWRFFSGDKEVLNLLIGSREKVKGKEGPRCYAKLASGDLVFLLSPALTKRVLGEYRTRALWAPVDAVQVERIDFNYPGKAFSLEKVDNAWKVAGKPDQKVNTKAVNETLAALAGLKAERTVVDKDADLKLFGLDPPQLTLEIRTRTGAKRVLEVGRSEGESKRAYARVVGGNRADVVIISEADGAKLIRDLAAFSEK